MKTTFVSISMLFVVACGTGASENGSGHAAIHQPTSDSPAVAPTAPTPVQQPQTAVVEVVPTPPQQQPVVQEPNAVVQEPNTVKPDTNPNHLKVDPVTGKYDYRYGVWSAGPVLTSTGECAHLHGAAWGYADGKVGPFPAAIDADGNLSWKAPNYSEIAKPDGTGAITLEDGTVCAIVVTP